MASILDKSKRLETEANPGLYIMNIFSEYEGQISNLIKESVDKDTMREVKESLTANILALNSYIISESEKNSKSLKEICDLNEQITLLKKDPQQKRNLRPLKKDWTVAELSVKYRRKNRTGIKIEGTQDANNVFLTMWDKDLLAVQEQFCVMYLSRSHEVIGFRNIATGALTGVAVDVNLIISLALQCRAAAIIIAHNHPSGNMQASGPDIELTKKINAACELLEICLLDHLILSPDRSYLSFSDEELL